MDEEMKRLAMKYGYNTLMQEAECVEEYGEWLHMSLMGFSDETLRKMAEYAAAHGKP